MRIDCTPFISAVILCFMSICVFKIERNTWETKRFGWFVWYNHKDNEHSLCHFILPAHNSLVPMKAQGSCYEKKI